MFVVNNLFTAGTDTTSATLQWSLLYLMHYPDVRKRVQQEIDEVVGRGRLPSVKDKPQLIYTEATIMEIQRLGRYAKNI